ncbi:hypothetical protein C1H46_033044 [Malus baccata]|uniref:Protein kinase domain-containing protein n=1 Tax=Malus baccata TaxID=106549 RepID=A0A540L4K3_MALBA|nr:hypothetical protein C1H46_033044 [Malus baccata]
MADLTADTVSVNQTIKKLQGKVVVVTGGASGIGEVTARKFVLHGARAVVIADIQDELGQTVVASLGPGRSTYIHCDVTDEDQVRSLIESTVKIYGHLDVMFSNAGIGCASQQTVLELDLSNYDKVMAVNARGMAACVKHAAKAMVEGGVRGSIVCMASAAAGQGGPMFTDYTMSKDAVMGLMRSASLQLGANGIRVNCVSPGPVVTPLFCWQFQVEAEDAENLYEAQLGLKAGKRMSAENVADAVVFLASDDSEFVTGHNLVVDDTIKEFGRSSFRWRNLSTNFLSGEIPDIGILSTFGNDSFVGNLDLCGQQVHKPCRTSLGFPAVLPQNAVSDEAAGKFSIPFHQLSMPSKRSSHYIKGVLIGAMSALGFAFFTLLTFLWVRFLSKKERVAKKYTEVKKQVNQEASTKLITFHGDMPYPSSEIIEKLESLDEEDVVGSGGFGTVYRMVMNDCGTFAVKRIDRSREGCDQVFERELEILGSIKHINLVNLRGYCRLPVSKLLIYDYLAMGSLDDFLHGKCHLSECARNECFFGDRLARIE